MVTYRNTEYGFEFQYPKTLTLSDGQKREVQIHTVDLTAEPQKDSTVLYLRSGDLLLSCYVEKKPSDFSNLQAHVEQEYQKIDEVIKKNHFNPLTDREIQPIELAGQQAVLITSTNRGILESTIYIEKNDYLYIMYSDCFYFIYHKEKIGAFPTEESFEKRLPMIEIIINTLTFS